MITRSYAFSGQREITNINEQVVLNYLSKLPNRISEEMLFKVASLFS